MRRAQPVTPLTESIKPMNAGIIDFTYDISENSLLINDLAASGNLTATGTPPAFIRAFLRGLIEEFDGDKDDIVVNTSCMSHIDPLEDTGFVIDEQESESHFVTAVYEYEK